jgi:hypothetical protein
MLSVCDSEECECGVGTGVKVTMMSETLVVMSFGDCQKQ